MPSRNDIEACDADLRRNGYAANPYCEVCHGFGSVHPVNWDGSPNYSTVIPCEAPGCWRDSYRKHTGSKEFLQNQGVSELREFKKFRNRQGTKDAKDAFEKLARGTIDFRLLLCYGGTGCGKTYLCEALTIELNRRLVPTRMYAAPDLFSEMKDGIQTGELEHIVMKLKTLPGLVIDDFVCSDWELGRMEEVVDARRRKEGAITVIATNMDLVKFKESSPRLYSRFSEAGYGEIILNSATDARINGI